MPKTGPRRRYTPNGPLLRRLRTDRGLTQEGMAAALGHSQPWVSRVENSVPQPKSFIITLGLFFATEPDDLILQPEVTSVTAAEPEPGAQPGGKESAAA